MAETKTTTSGGIGFTGCLTIAFIVLKLCNVIDWSWWWVLSPLWVPFALLISIGIIYVIVNIPGYLKQKRKLKRVRQIMLETGKHEWAASQQYHDEKGTQPLKSKWQQRIEEMQKEHQQRGRI